MCDQNSCFKISVGILAYNEESSIGSTVRSVLAQSIFIDLVGVVYAELVVVPNGCRDRTVERASEVIHEVGPLLGDCASARVSELLESGKESAWNHFVHEASSKDSDYLVLVDADVRLEHPDVLRDLVACLAAHPDAVLAGGVPVKHIELGGRLSILDRLSVNATSLRLGMKGIFAGCLYCGRASVLRSFRLPTALMGEDAFVRAMIVTRGFTQPDDPSLIVRARTARVVFEAYTSPTEVLRNKTRRMLELTINSMFYERFWAEAKPGRDAGRITLECFEANPGWSEEFVQREFVRRGRRPIPSRFVTSQFKQLRHHSFRKRVALLPVALATLPLNAVAYRRATKAVLNGSIRKLWDKPAEMAVLTKGP